LLQNGSKTWILATVGQEVKKYYATSLRGGGNLAMNLRRRPTAECNDKKS